MPYVDGAVQCGWCGQEVTLKVCLDPPEEHTSFTQECPRCGALVEAPGEVGGVAACFKKGKAELAQAEPRMLFDG